MAGVAFPLAHEVLTSILQEKFLLATCILESSESNAHRPTWKRRWRNIGLLSLQLRGQVCRPQLLRDSNRLVVIALFYRLHCGTEAWGFAVTLRTA